MTIFKTDHPRPIDRVIDFFGEEWKATHPGTEPRQVPSAVAPELRRGGIDVLLYRPAEEIAR